MSNSLQNPNGIRWKNCISPHCIICGRITTFQFPPLKLVDNYHTFYGNVYVCNIWECCHSAMQIALDYGLMPNYYFSYY